MHISKRRCLTASATERFNSGANPTAHNPSRNANSGATPKDCPRESRSAGLTFSNTACPGCICMYHATAWRTKAIWYIFVPWNLFPASFSFWTYKTFWVSDNYIYRERATGSTYRSRGLQIQKSENDGKYSSTIQIQLEIVRSIYQVHYRSKCQRMFCNRYSCALESRNINVSHENTNTPPNRRYENEMNRLIDRILMIRSVKCKFLFKWPCFHHGLSNYTKE